MPLNNKSAKLSEVSCEQCFQTGTMKAANNVAAAEQISCICSNCAHYRWYSILKTVRNKDGKIEDYIVSIDPVSTPALAGQQPTNSNRSPIGEEKMQPKKNKRTFYHESTPDDVPGSPDENIPVAGLKSYFDVLAYKLDKDGMPEIDDPANRRFPKSDEDVAPQNESIMPRKDRLKYRNESKPFQAVASDKPDYVEIGVFSESHPTILTNSVKKSLLKESLDNDIELEKTAGLADASFIEPSGEGGGQWCPKVRHAVPFYVCSHYCIDGRRIPQTDREFETYKDYLIEGGDEFGKVFCGYKDWLKREVTGQYPGWVEDYIQQRGGEVSKNFKPFQHQMNLDDGQRRQMPVYPDHKLIEKRLEVEKKHTYGDQKSLTFASDSVKNKIEKKASVEKKKLS